MIKYTCDIKLNILRIVKVCIFIFDKNTGSNISYFYSTDRNFVSQQTSRVFFVRGFRAAHFLFGVGFYDKIIWG